MSYNVGALDTLVEQFERIPGIGHKSAQRMAFYVLNMPEEDAKKFADSILGARQKIHQCKKCCNLTEDEYCSICSNEARDQTVVCVVEDPRDVDAFERTHEFKGTYHVLHGAISPMSGIGPDQLTIKELRSNIESYAGMKVAFNGIITVNDSNTVYVEDFDPETGLYYGMTVYYGFGMNGTALEILTVGNEVRIVGSVQYYEGGGTWQVSDLNYRMMKPDDPGNIQKLSDGHTPAFTLTTADTFVNGQVTIESEDSSVTAPYAQLALSTSVQMQNLVVKHVYTTTNEESSSKGAMTLYCEADGIPVTVRTSVLLDENGELITADAYLGRTIDVKGIVEFFDGNYQIKVFSRNNIIVHE